MGKIGFATGATSAAPAAHSSEARGAQAEGAIRGVAEHADTLFDSHHAGWQRPIPIEEQRRLAVEAERRHEEQLANARAAVAVEAHGGAGSPATP